MEKIAFLDPSALFRFLFSKLFLLMSMVNASVCGNVHFFFFIFIFNLYLSKEGRMPQISITKVQYPPNIIC
jgi:hypothetical protein